MFHELKMGRLEFYWFNDFQRWGIAVALEREGLFNYWELAFALGPAQFGVVLAD